jgi:hypothetical protein
LCQPNTKLWRVVAGKLPPEALARDFERLLSFRRESKLLASLACPGLVAIHGPEE